MTLIDRMLKAMKDAEALGPPPQREYRMHPDDFKELRGHCVPHVFEPGSMDRFSGLQIVLDEDAARLPRLKSSPATPADPKAA
jgi:hypothetical protein